MERLDLSGGAPSGDPSIHLAYIPGVEEPEKARVGLKWQLLEMNELELLFKVTYESPLEVSTGLEVDQILITFRNFQDVIDLRGEQLHKVVVKRVYVPTQFRDEDEANAIQIAASAASGTI